ncbi:MAG: CAP domain-containing protein [Cyanobacteria bacterium P01_F01_bin.86]
MASSTLQIFYEVLALTNEFRAQNGIAALSLNAELTDAAQFQAEHMALNDYFDHASPTGESTLGGRLQSVEYSASLVAENIAVVYTSAESVVNGWMASSTHRNNILNPDFTELGVGYFFLEEDTGSTNHHDYWVQVFGTGDTNSQTQTLTLNTDVSIPETSAAIRPVNFISGSGSDDVLPGSDASDTISGGAGDDKLNGKQQNDFIFGDAGDDVIGGGKGSDQLFGGTGADRVYGKVGNDLVFGEDGDDILGGGQGADQVFGEAGDDVVQGKAGQDLVVGGTGNDVLTGGDGNDTLIGVDQTLGRGRGELDVLMGQEHRNMLVLGDENGVFYDDGSTANDGYEDYARIVQMTSKDQIQLAGSLDDYTFMGDVAVNGRTGTGIFWLGDGSTNGEFIALVQDTSIADTQATLTFV